MGKRTPLYPNHLSANATIVEFAGWDMPLHYGSQVQEHHQVRQNAGVFDVSHMTIVDCRGPGAAQFLQLVLANDIARLVPGKALYTCMLNEQGGVIDDLIVYKITDDHYRLIVNAATHDKDLAWLQQHASGLQCELQERADLSMLALQGPDVHLQVPAIFNEAEAKAMLSLKPFHAVQSNDYFISFTGYTGEKGFEVILPGVLAPALWEKIIQSGIRPCGLGARDTLRLEAGLNLYGSDMDETVTPLESNLTWTVAWEPKERHFIGREVIEKQRKEGAKHRLVGLVLQTQGVLRNHQKVYFNNKLVGEVTSGSFSPTLNKGIALARVDANISDECAVEIRGKLVPAKMIAPPFIRKNQSK